MRVNSPISPSSPLFFKEEEEEEEEEEEKGLGTNSLAWIRVAMGFLLSKLDSARDLHSLSGGTDDSAPQHLACRER